MMTDNVKGETLTHLYGSALTEKDHPIIAFRGKLDTLAALILEAQLLGAEQGNQRYVADLREILEFVRGLLSAEYHGKLLGEIRLLGMSSEEMREKSHHPEKYFDQGHLLTDYRLGALSLRLNLLRAVTRETELAAITALRDPEDSSKSKRPDIAEALNRLSSLFYILMYHYREA
jgi:ethanolamine utilization cobalamin adenosyltransferase